VSKTSGDNLLGGQKEKTKSFSVFKSKKKKDGFQESFQYTSWASELKLRPRSLDLAGRKEWDLRERNGKGCVKKRGCGGGGKTVAFKGGRR